MAFSIASDIASISAFEKPSFEKLVRLNFFRADATAFFMDDVF